MITYNTNRNTLHNMEFKKGACICKVIYLKKEKLVKNNFKKKGKKFEPAQKL